MSKQLSFICDVCSLWFCDSTECDRVKVKRARWRRNSRDARARRRAANPPASEPMYGARFRTEHEAIYFRRYYEDNRIRKVMAIKAKQWAAKGWMGPPNPVRQTLDDKLRAYRANG